MSKIQAILATAILLVVLFMAGGIAGYRLCKKQYSNGSGPDQTEYVEDQRRIDRLEEENHLLRMRIESGIAGIDRVQGRLASGVGTLAEIGSGVGTIKENADIILAALDRIYEAYRALGEVEQTLEGGSGE